MHLNDLTFFHTLKYQKCSQCKKRDFYLVGVNVRKGEKSQFLSKKVIESLKRLQHSIKIVLLENFLPFKRPFKDAHEGMRCVMMALISVPTFP